MWVLWYEAMIPISARRLGGGKHGFAATAVLCAAFARTSSTSCPHTEHTLQEPTQNYQSHNSRVSWSARLLPRAQSWKYAEENSGQHTQRPTAACT